METAQAVGLESHVMIRILFFFKTKFEAIIASLLRLVNANNALLVNIPCAISA
tara:strand:+ start:3915 stop:4073 length:159 start_codon:yes stop_codon:yes gene_type:complete